MRVPRSVSFDFQSILLLCFPHALDRAGFGETVYRFLTRCRYGTWHKTFFCMNPDTEVSSRTWRNIGGWGGGVSCFVSVNYLVLTYLF